MSAERRRWRMSCGAVAAVLIAACSGDDDDAAAGRDAAVSSMAGSHDDSRAGSGGSNERAGSSAPSTAGSAADAAMMSPKDAGMQSAHDSGDDASSSLGRRFRLAAAGTQMLVEGPELGLQLTPANLADDVDVVAVHQEFYGVPWEAFVANTEPPAEWTAKMTAIAAAAHAVSDDVFLSISMLNGGRSSLAARTIIEDGDVKSEDNWAGDCYDFATAPDGAQMRDAFIRYLEHMLELFAPRYLNYAIEVNLYFEKCPAGTAGLIEVANAAYAAAKAADPDIIAFPSFQIDHLYGVADDSCPDGMQRDDCYERNYAQIVDMQRDRFAMSSYPFLQGQRLSDVPADWFERAAARGGERALIAETGWLSTDLIAQNGFECPTVISATEDIAAGYLARVLDDAERIPLELVTWWSNRDLLPAGLMTNCPCDYDPTWCSVVDIFRQAAGAPTTPGADYFGEILLKAFGTMGIRDYEGNPKPQLHELWSAAQARP